MDDIPIYPFSLEELERFPNAGDDIFFKRAIEMIDVGFNAGMDKITLFKIIEEDAELFLNLPATSWVDTLKDSITY